ncbi:MAG: transposase [Candidatus Kerfeldbacteria bacterium]|nr:transposase [Candidatus Kerfeldbacteria bacterium]
MQSPITFPKIGRLLKQGVQSLALDIGKTVAEKRYVELVCFALMPNHFHLAVHELQEGGVTQYLHRLSTAYTKYVNTKYQRTGHTFEGTYQAVHVKSNEQLLYLSAYIHLNPREVSGWDGKEHIYPWSSYQDYRTENRWSGLIQPDIILDQFSNPSEYQHFVEESGARQKILLDIAEVSKA